MKKPQIAILILLLIVAGLLYVIYRGQSRQPEATLPASQTTPTAALPQPSVPTEQPAATTAAAQPAATPAPAAKRPSPAGERRTGAAPAGPAQPEQTAQMPAPAAAPAGTAPAPPAEETQPRATAPVPLTPPSGTPSAPPTPRKVTIPAGTLLSVRLAETLSSEKNQPGDTFPATLDQPLIVESLVLAERGARLEGRVLEVERAGRVRGLASMKIHLTCLHTSDGQVVEIHTEPFGVTAETSKADDAKKIGVGAAIGAAIGAIAGGGKGAAIGAGVGGAAGTGTVMATRGKPAVLANETRLSFRLREPVTLTEKIK